MLITTTPRLTIRQFQASDLDDLAPILANPEVMHFSATGVKTRAQIKAFLDKILHQYQQEGFGLYALLKKSTQQMLGYCGLLVWLIDGKREIEIGYRLTCTHWGQGLGTEAALAIRDYAWQQLGLDRLICIIEPDNYPSIRVAQKIGMTYERATVIMDIPVGIYGMLR